MSNLSGKSELRSRQHEALAQKKLMFYTIWILRATVFCISIVYFGYWVGKFVFR